MDFSDSLSKWGTDDFKEAVEIQLGEHQFDLPLDELCESGGGLAPDDEVEFDLGDPEQQGDLIILVGDLWFTESIAIGCPDINFPEKRHGQIIVEFNRKSGRADVSVERAERNLENY